LLKADLYSGLLQRVDLRVDTVVSVEHAATIFKAEVCRFNNRLKYIGMLEGSWSCDPKEGVNNGPDPGQ
jgi:hypothetical protein